MKKIIRTLKSFIPETLPQNSSQVIAFARDVVNLAGQDPENKNLIFAVVSDMMRVDVHRIKAPRRLFVKQVMRALTNAAAFEVLEAIRAESKNEKAAAEQSGN